MTEINVEWNEENVRAFVEYSTFSKTKGVKIIFAVFAVCYALLTAGCLTAFFMLGESLMLVAAIVLTAIVAGYGVMLLFLLKKYTKQILSANGGDETNTVTLTDELIIVSRNDVPVGKLEWSGVDSVSFNDKRGAAYIMTKTNALLLLEYKNITGGTKEELKTLLEKKNAELSKKA